MEALGLSKSLGGKMGGRGDRFAMHVRKRECATSVGGNLLGQKRVPRVGVTESKIHESQGCLSKGQSRRKQKRRKVSSLPRGGACRADTERGEFLRQNEPGCGPGGNVFKGEKTIGREARRVIRAGGKKRQEEEEKRDAARIFGLTQASRAKGRGNRLCGRV